jgi:hypothetical protein
MIFRAFRSALERFTDQEFSSSDDGAGFLVK